MLVNRNKEHDGSMQKRTADKTAVRFYSCRPYTLQLRFGRSRRAALRVRRRSLAADDARGQALAVRIPLLRAGHDRRIQKRTAQPHRHAEHTVKRTTDFPPGMKPAPQKPAASSTAPASPAVRGPFLSCKRPPKIHPMPKKQMVRLKIMAAFSCERE